jgi:hypothetical protein
VRRALEARGGVARTEHRRSCEWVYRASVPCCDCGADRAGAGCSMQTDWSILMRSTGKTNRFVYIRFRSCRSVRQGWPMTGEPN